MNLYWTQEIEGEYGVFVFAKRAGLAKSAFMQFDGFVDYVDVRATLIGKTDKVSELAVVDYEEHPLYPVVLELGGEFTEVDND